MTQVLRKRRQSPYGRQGGGIFLLLRLMKNEALEKLIVKLKLELETTKRSAQSAHEAATHEELVAENKYDTKGLEASYLAGAQNRRAKELQIQIDELEKLFPFLGNKKEKVGLTSLVQLQDEEEKLSWLFMLPSQGGHEIESSGELIKTITPESPLGKKLLGKEVSDEIEMNLKDKARYYEIIDLL